MAIRVPATFTLAAALGARTLAKLDVLPTRLSAVDEAASIDILCSDKTGTLTQNELAVTAVHAMSGFDESHVLGLAAQAAAASRATTNLPELIKFIPFDPVTKMSEATAADSAGATARIVKGAFALVAGLAEKSPEASTTANQPEAQGSRVLAVAADAPTARPDRTPPR